MPNPHHVTLTFGKHKGTLLTRVPVSYLKWMINEKGMDTHWRKLAQAEFERRGDTMPKVELTGHAIDNASLRVQRIWKKTRINIGEGLYSWLTRITLEAMEKGERLESGKISYLGLQLVIEPGEEFPVLKTIMRETGRQQG